MAKARKYWLMKTEPEVYSIDDLARERNKTTCWDGVRNYQARNFMRDEMKIGDLVLLYHSSTDPPGVVGVASVVREAYPDHTSWDARDKHYDPKSTKGNPRWFMVDIQLQQTFERALPLDDLRQQAALKNMELLRKGSRLSVQPVRKEEFDTVLKLAGARK